MTSPTMSQCRWDSDCSTHNNTYCRTQLCTVLTCSCTSASCLLSSMLSKAKHPSGLSGDHVYPTHNVSSAGSQGKGLWQTTYDVSWGEGSDRLLSGCPHTQYT